MSEDNVLRNLARQLLLEMSSGTEDTPVDEHLLKTAETLIQAHQFYVQLSFVDLIIQRMKKLGIYFETMDVFADEINTDDMAEMTASEKVRGIQAMTNATRVQLDTVNAMLTNKDAANVLISNLRENFGGVQDAEPGEAKEILDDIRDMDPNKRQRVLRGTIDAIRRLAQQEVAEGEEP